MNTKHLSLLFILLSAITSCKPSKEKSAAEINAFENRLFSPGSMGFSRASADSLLALYDAFIEDNPEDSLAPVYLFKAGSVAMNGGAGNRAVTYFDKYIQAFPQGPKAPLCLFFKAFAYENVVHDIEQARENYLRFIEKYPDNEFTDDAKLALMNLGKSPDQMVREFELQHKADSIRLSDSLARVRK